MLAAFDLAPLFPWGSVEVHTIGAPRPGNAAFAKVRCGFCPRQLNALLLQLSDLKSRHRLAPLLSHTGALGNCMHRRAPLKPVPDIIWLTVGPDTLAVGAFC